MIYIAKFNKIFIFTEKIMNQLKECEITLEEAITHAARGVP